MHEGQRLRSTDRNQVVELIEETLNDGFSYGYLVVENGADVCAIQPYLILDQDLLGGINGVAKRCFDAVRRVWPRFMRAHTLMARSTSFFSASGRSRKMRRLPDLPCDRDRHALSRRPVRRYEGIDSMRHDMVVEILRSAPYFPGPLLAVIVCK